MERGSTPLTWTPHGCTDAIDSSQSFPGCMSALTNLIPDPSTADLWMARPAATRLTNFPTFLNPGFMSCGRVVGNFFYGLMRSNRTPGFEEPFVYDLVNSVLVTITGVTGLNVPSQVPSSGPWTPPIIEVIGSKVVVTHTGFSATAFKFGWFDIANLAAITWNAGNTTGAVVLTVVPTFVSQFNGRAYYIVNLASQPAVVFSDPLNPIQVTNASQVLTFGDAVPLTAIGQLRLFNQSGGIIQALMVFKGATNTYQITGDSALSTLTVNALSVATGTNSPLGIAATPKGLAFVSPDGMRLIDFQGNVSDPIGQDGKGITQPITYSNVPSRMILACNGSLLRLSTQNANAINTPFQEWWYDIGRQTWNGPHTSAFGVLQAFMGTFVGQLVAQPVGLWQSDTVQGPLSVFTETPDPNVRFLVHFDGANASPVIADDAPNPHVFTAGGNAQLDTANKKFGSASGLLDGVGDFWSTPAVADLSPGSVRFTLEGWFRCTAAGGTARNMVGQTDVAFTAAQSPFDIVRLTTNVIRASISNGAAITQVDGTTQFTDVLNPGFHHVAWCWDGTNCRLFLDGVQEGGNLAFAGPVAVSAQPFCLGTREASNGAPWLGNIDEWEFTIGVAKYTANFTPPAAPFSFLSSALMQFNYGTAFFPDTQQMGNVALRQTLLHAALAANTSYAVTITDQNGTVLNSVPIALAGSVSIWGAFTWGVGLWGAAGGALAPRIIPWTKPNVFAKAQINVQGSCNSTVRLGMLHMRYKNLKYLTNLGATG